MALGFLILVLIGLNAFSYVQKEKAPDNEINPNRSTYNVGATGTRAFYDLLKESGRNPSRWQKPSTALLNYEADSPATLVVIGKVQRDFEEEEVESLLKWVSGGGTLVLIDRQPPKELVRTTAAWEVLALEGDVPFFNLDPSNQQQMTAGTDAAKPSQPTLFTEKVNAVQPSRFTSSVDFSRLSQEEAQKRNQERKIVKSPFRRIGVPAPPRPTPAPVKTAGDDEKNVPEEFEDPSGPKAGPGQLPAKETGSGSGSGSGSAEPGNREIIIQQAPPSVPPAASAEKTEGLTAPVVHLNLREKNLLVDFPYGDGRIVFLADPYIVSNSGISLVDNAQLAINVVSSRPGIVAFDEYHQGYGANNNRLINYFEGTPVLAFIWQFAVLVGLVFLVRGRRFARPLPAPEPNRLSKLEYVSAMAELQQRTGAFDLAMENIYKDFRRRVARLTGVDNFTTSRQRLAALIAERSRFSSDQIDQLMSKCEDIMHGEPTNKKEIVELTRGLREIETELGLQRRR